MINPRREAGNQAASTMVAKKLFFHALCGTDASSRDAIALFIANDSMRYLAVAEHIMRCTDSPVTTRSWEYINAAWKS